PPHLSTLSLHDALPISLLANSGNLWLWQPQVRYEERFQFTESTGLRARLGVYQTNETLAAVATGVKLSPSRPAFEGRFELFHNRSEEHTSELQSRFDLV